MTTLGDIRSALASGKELPSHWTRETIFSQYVTDLLNSPNPPARLEYQRGFPVLRHVQSGRIIWRCHRQEGD